MLKINEQKTRFINVIKEKIHRDGIDALMDWLEKSDLYSAPASTRFHGNYEGGLLEHCLNVYDCLVGMNERHSDFGYSDETIAVVALFHDLCKVNFYKKGFRNRKNDDGQWEKVEVYEIDEKFPAGHGSKSVIILQQFMKLTGDEILAILWHMGGWSAEARGGDHSINSAYDKCKLCAMLNLADGEASHLMEETKG